MSAARGRVIVVGGAGFIGSHFTDALLADERTRRVTLYDNFSSGQEWHYAHHREDPRLEVVRGDANDLDALCSATEGHDLVIHLASNPDIAAAMTNPAVDFDDGTLITHHVVEAMRRTGVQRIAYASGSGVYGDLGEHEAAEDHGPLVPVSTYGASKLAGEALISAYAYMFDIQGVAFRFGNVVGRRQTHGVGFDFVRRLREDPSRLEVLGDGSQSKSYVLVSDVVAAVLLAVDTADGPFRTFNVATGDYVTVREIAELALDVVGLDRDATRIEYGDQPRGWKGDVPIVRLDTTRIRSLGWSQSVGSREALRISMKAMLDDLSVAGGRVSSPAVFLDRDGVLNEPVVRDGLPYPPQDLADLRLLPGVKSACRRLSGAGLKLICITNQPDIARGTQDPARVTTMNSHLQEMLHLDEVVTCPHDDADGCECRKPRPGMILGAARRLDLDLSQSVTVGDRWRDIEAGRSAGTWTVFIDRGYAERSPDRPDLTVAELKESVEWIIERTRQQS